METVNRKRRRFHSAGYLKSTFLYLGTLLFILSRVIEFVLLLQSASDRAKNGQNMPAAFSAWGITWRVLAVGLLIYLFVLLVRQRRGLSRIAQNRRYFLMNLLIFAWGAIGFIDALTELTRSLDFFSIVSLLCVLASLVAPPLLLQLSDSRRMEPDDTVLLLVGIGGLAFSAISIVILLLFLRKSYTFWPLARDLLFRAALALYALAVLLRALDIRSSLPIYAVSPSPTPDPAPRPQPRTPRVTCPDCGCRVPVTLPNCPRCGRDVGDLPPD